MTLQAVVIGAGWAGEGHAQALRSVGAEVVALCGRTPAATEACAQQLGIDQVRFDWRQALAEFRPDVVAITTPAGPHREMAVAAAELRCHIVCEKPLAVNQADARAMLRAVETAGVKHAYAATSRYAPCYAYAHQLVRDELIGRVREIEYSIHMAMSNYLPYHWFYQLDQGGGLLNQGFTHMLAQVRRLTGGQVTAAMGETRRLIERAPVGPAIHDFRTWMGSAMEPAQTTDADWHDVDADTGFTLLTRLRLPDGHTASALFHTSGQAASQQPNTLALHGTDGTLLLTAVDGLWPTAVQHYDPDTDAWQDLPTPDAYMQAVPATDNPVQRDWNQLYREFVAHIQGEGDAGYLTFRDGWIDAEIIDIVRNHSGWVNVSDAPSA